MPKIKCLRTCATMLLASCMLSACAAPPALQLISLAIDGISYLATDKTIADHGLSSLTEKDCKILRGFQKEEICQPEEEEQLELLDGPEVKEAVTD